MNDINPIDWIARWAGCLHERWRSVEPADLEEVAVGIWQNPVMAIPSVLYASDGSAN